MEIMNVKKNKQIRTRQNNLLSDTASYRDIRPSSYDDAGLSWLQINLQLSIHARGRYLKYESYFITCMIFLFCIWPAECFSCSCWLGPPMVAKSEIPHPIHKLNRSPPEISIRILHGRRRKQQQQ